MYGVRETFSQRFIDGIIVLFWQASHSVRCNENMEKFDAVCGEQSTDNRLKTDLTD